MPEEVKGNTTETLGWRTELPESLRSHEAFASYKTKDDLWNGHIAAVTKSKDLEGKLADSIPKLPDNATQEERDVFFQSLGKPEKAEEYAFDAEDENAPEWTDYWKNEMFSLDLSKSQASALSKSFNSQMQKMVEAHNAGIQKEIGEASTKLKAELGDKYDASVELAQRLWKRDVDGDFDKDFASESSKTRYSIIRYILKMAAKTGEDTSLRGGAARQAQVPSALITYDKSPAPPPRRI